MKIAVCVKGILDPEIPARAFKINTETKRAIPPIGMELVISDYDECAVEAALKIKDSLETTITIISLGDESAKNIIRRCMAMGADTGVLLCDPLFDDSDSFSTSAILTEAIKKLGDFDLILCGRQEGDWDAGQVGSGIAELMDIPSVTMAGKIEIQNGKAVVERIITDGREIVEIPLPALATVSNEIGEPRYPSLRGIREANKKEIPTWDAQVINPVKTLNKMLSVSIPTSESECILITGETPEEAGVNLALRLKADKII